MGNWTIVIIGTGAHHNKDYEYDADKIFRETVKQLEKAGHQIEHASITYSARDEVHKGEIVHV